MIDLIFTPYNEEMLYSWLGRYNSICGSDSYFTTRRELFSEKHISVNVYYARYLDNLVNNMPNEFGLTAEKLIYENTIFPLFKPFLNDERVHDTILIMKNGKGDYLGRMGFNAISQLGFSNVIKYCPQCYLEDIKKYKQSFLHRNHQVPGNIICGKHKLYLNNYEIMNEKRVHVFKDINCLELDLVTQNEVERELQSYFIDLNNDIQFILQKGLGNCNANTIFEKYIFRLKELNYKNISIKHKKLNQDFLKYYPKEFLIKLKCYFDCNNRKNWINYLITKNKQFVSPLKHILFIRFLFGSLQAFIDYKVEEVNVNKKLYPCLNPVANHYKQEVVSDVTIKNKNKNKNGKKIQVGTYKCACGFIYSRNISCDLPQKIYKVGYILQYGELWDNTLKQYILKQKYKLHEIAELMKTSSPNIKRQCVRLGLLQNLPDGVKVDKIISKNKNRKDAKIRKIEEKLEESKNNILEFIKDNEDVTRTIIEKKFCKDYYYVQTYDYGWMDKILPSGRYGIKILKSKRNNTDILDNYASRCIKELANEILSKNKNIRITKTYIGRKLHLSIILNNSYKDKLPKTFDTLSEVCESYEKYKQRMEIEINTLCK